MWLELSFLVIQVAAMAGIAWLIGFYCLKQRPDLTVVSGYLAIGCISVVLGGMLFGIKRPLELDWQCFATIATTEYTQEPDSQSSETSAATRVDETRTPSNLDARSGITLSQVAAWLSRLERTISPATSDLRTTGLLWLLIIAAVVWMLRLLEGSRQIWILDRGSKKVVHPRLNDLVLDWSRQLQLRVVPEIRSSQIINSPCVTWLRPRVIYVPKDFIQWSEPEQDVCLAHELAHLQGRDPMGRFLLQVTEVLWFWNPLCRSLKRQVILGQELVADRTAMGLLEDSVNYVCELARLRLRLNQAVIPRYSSLQVSLLSDGLIRRIEMLQGMQETLTSRSSCWQWSIGIATTVLLSAIGLWGLKLSHGQDEAATSEPLRVALAERSAEPVPALFSRPTSSPWIDYGPQAGFVRVRVSELAKHPLVIENRSMLVGLLETQLFAPDGVATSVGLADFGFRLESLEFFEAATTLNYASVDPATSNGSKHTLSIGAKLDKNGIAFGMQSHQDVQWRDLLSNIAKTLGYFESHLETAIAGAPVSDKTLKFTPDPDDVPIYAGLSETQIAMWKLVDGGVVTAVNQVLGTNRLAQDANADSSEVAKLKLLSSMESLAVGYDLREGTSTEWLRVAIEPKGDTTGEQLAETVTAFLNESVAGLTEAQQSRLAPWLKTLDVRVIQSNGSEIVLIQGAVSASDLLLL